MKIDIEIEHGLHRTSTDLHGVIRYSNLKYLVKEDGIAAGAEDFRGASFRKNLWDCRRR